jgi:hypothetical protein
VAEIIRTLGIAHVTNDSQNPYMQMRGTKFNIPLDDSAVPSQVRQRIGRHENDLDAA